MNIFDKKERDDFIFNLDQELFLDFYSIINSIVQFYSATQPNEDAENFLILIIDLLLNGEPDIETLRNRLKTYIENNNGTFKNLSSFPKYFLPIEKTTRGLEFVAIKIKIQMAQTEKERNYLIDYLNEIPIVENKEYRVLTKNEEIEYCLSTAIDYCRDYHHLKKSKDRFTFLKRANLYYGYACGLLGTDAGIYQKLNEDKTPQDMGGDVLKHRAELAKQQVVTMWNDRFNNPNLIKKGKAEFGRYIYNNPHLITDKNGNPLKKPNGEQYYNDPKYIEGLIPKNT